MDENAEFISKVEKYLQILVFTIRSSMSGNGYAWGTTTLLSSLKSIHNLDFFPSSLLIANVTGAANRLYDSSVSPVFI